MDRKLLHGKWPWRDSFFSMKKSTKNEIVFGKTFRGTCPIPEKQKTGKF